MQGQVWPVWPIIYAMALKFKHHTYKITFPGMPWFYWGVHSGKENRVKVQKEDQTV